MRLFPLLVLILLAAPERNRTHRVGPRQPYKRVEDANKAARAGDVIEVYPGTYQKVGVFVRQSNLTFRAVPRRKGERVKLDGKGFDHSGRGSTPRAIFQFNKGTDHCLVEGFELTGASNGSHNGAGVRINQANHVTIRNCEIHHNDMGIMSNSDGTQKTAVNQVIEHCVIHHNGNFKHPGYNHNLYLGGTSVTLRFCEVFESLTGHNVKSRAHHNRIEVCHIHDSANREFDLVDGKDTEAPASHAVLLGNVIVKKKNMKGNKAVIHFGQDGGKQHDGTIHLVHNTIVTPYISPVVDLSASKAKAHFAGNIVWDGGAGTRGQKLVSVRKGAKLTGVTGARNWLSTGFDFRGTKIDPPTTFRGQQPGLSKDYRLARRTINIADAGPRSVKVPATPGGRDEKPLAWQYKHPADKEKRRSDRKTDIGAYERQ